MLNRKVADSYGKHQVKYGVPQGIKCFTDYLVTLQDNHGKNKARDQAFSVFVSAEYERL